MSIELLYTSAPKGLKRGSRGFCTVLTTQRAPANITSRLEALSGYRQLFPPDSPQAALNPVAYSHLRIVVAGRSLSVLSRVTAYGSDYTGRTNKIAHHVVPDPHEYGPAGPAWVMMQPSVMRTLWSGQCETPESGPIIPTGDQDPGACNTWHRVAGDAGWGGVVADALVASSPLPTWIIYRADHQNLMLPLLNEAIALLPIERRWEATFSTYATNIPPNVDCKVRCVLDGTDEARFAQAKSGVIDLTKPLGNPSDNSLTQQARGLQIPAPEIPTSSTSDDSTATEESESDGESKETVINLDDEPDVMPAAPMRHGYTNQNSMHGEVAPPPIQPPPLPPIKIKRKRNLLVPIAAFLFIAIVAASAWFIGEKIAGQNSPSTPPPLQPDPNEEVLVDDDAMQPEREPPVSNEDSPNQTPAANAAKPIELTLKIEPAQFVQAIENIRSGEPAVGDQLVASGMARTELLTRPAKFKWQSDLQSIGDQTELKLPTQNVDNENHDAVETLAVYSIDEHPTISGASIDAFVGKEALDLIVRVTIDAQRKRSLYRDQIDAFASAAASIVKLRTTLQSISALAAHLPDGTRESVVDFLRSVPTDDVGLVDALLGDEISESSWAAFDRVKSITTQLATDGGPTTWSEKQREAITTIDTSLLSVSELRTSFFESNAILKKGQKISVPNIVFYDAGESIVAAYDIRLNVSW